MIPHSTIPMKNPSSQSALSNPRILLGVALCSAGVLFAMLSMAVPIPSASKGLRSAAAGNWSIVDSPNTFTSVLPYFGSVTCVSASDCWAVGSYVPGSYKQTLIEHWDGTSWIVTPSPNINETENNFLTSVTCNSASDCWAVGTVGDNLSASTLIVHWNGTSWAITPSPNPGTINELSGVTCASPSDCWAVGSYYNGTVSRTLVERWDGISWTIVASPNASAASNGLRGVTCVSASNCWAVGNSFNPATQRFESLAEKWDGISWVIVSSPHPPGETGLIGIACASASECWAVGYRIGPAYQTLIQRWDGTSWTIIPSPNSSVSETNLLYGVTCVATSECWAVGYNIDSSSDVRTLIERWNGSSWTIEPSPNTTINNKLFTVACSSAADCWALGEDIVEHWSGTSWDVVPSATLPGLTENVLRSVACASGSDCWAVGDSSNPTTATSETLIQRWNGSSWFIVPSLNSSESAYNKLFGVTCVSVSDCWAVGSSQDGTPGGSYSLIERWNGTSWSIVTSPNNPGDALASVTCLSASSCWAVGDHFDDTSSSHQTLIERWNGTSWTVVTSPSIPGVDNILLDVTCTSASDCWAVGYFYNVTSGVFGELIQHWDGTLWSRTRPSLRSPLSGRLS